MGRKKAIKEPKPKKEPEITPDEDIEIHEEGSIVTESEESTLPVKDLFRINEVADYFSVSERDIRLWIAHGHLIIEKGEAPIKVSLEAMLKCRFKGKIDTLPNKEYLRPDEVALYFSLSVKTIYGWIDEGKIEAVRIGPSKTIRIKRDIVEGMPRPNIE